MILKRHRLIELALLAMATGALLMPLPAAAEASLSYATICPQQAFDTEKLPPNVHQNSHPNTHHDGMYLFPWAGASSLKLSNTALSQSQTTCQSQAIPVSLTHIRWATLISNDYADQMAGGILLKFEKKDTMPLVVKEIQPVEPPKQKRETPPTPIPMDQNLIPQLTMTPFGVEERVQLSQTPDKVVMTCRPGSAHAGVVLSHPKWFLAAIADQLLQTQLEGEGTFEWMMADSDHNRQTAPISVGYTQVSSVQTRYELPLKTALSEQRAGWHPWNAWIVQCPKSEQEASQSHTLTLRDLRLLSRSTHVESQRFEPLVRSMWVWKAHHWLENPDSMISTLQKTGVSRIYADIPLTKDESALMYPKQTQAMVAKARKAGLSVWVVEGDPHYLLPEGRKQVLRRAKTYKAYNDSVDRRYQLAGLQYDIEPYLMQGYFVNPKLWNQVYVELMASVHQSTQLPIDSTLPFWFATAQTPTGFMMDELAPHVARVTVMDYRTNTSEVLQFAQPYLYWGLTNRRPVTIALETGHLPNEQFNVYRQSNVKRGVLWMLPFDKDHHLLVLLDDNLSLDAANAIPFRYSHEALVKANRLTFEDNATAFHKVMPDVEKQLLPWRSFDGVAIHYYSSYLKFND